MEVLKKNDENTVKIDTFIYKNIIFYIMLLNKINKIIYKLLEFENNLIHKNIKDIEKEAKILYNDLFDTSIYLLSNIDSLLYNTNKALHNINLVSHFTKNDIYSHNYKIFWLKSFNYLINKKKTLSTKSLEMMLSLRFMLAWIYTKESFEYIETDIKLLDSIQKFNQLYFCNNLNFIINSYIKKLIIIKIKENNIRKNNYIENKFIWYLL